MEPALQDDDVRQLVRLELPARSAFVGLARSTVVAAATTVPRFDHERLDDLRLAVSEACTNAVEAHRSAGSTDRVVVQCLLDGVGLHVRIEDRGPGFDPAAVPTRSTGPDALDPPVDRGWGIQLIRALVDTVRFTSQATGTEVVLSMRYRGAET